MKSRLLIWCSILVPATGALAQQSTVEPPSEEASIASPDTEEPDGDAAGEPRAAVGTAFTCQGQLKSGSVPATGTFDLRFSLYDDASSIVAGPICRENVALTNGLFTVELDFGAVFDGQNRHLEIGVRPDSTAGNCGSGVYTILSPRQRLTATPYALKAIGVDGYSLDAADGSPVDAVLVDNSGRVGIGTTSPTMPLTVRGSGGNSDWIQLEDAAGVDSWHLNFQGGGLNFVETGVAAYRLFLRDGGNVGVGINAPDEKLAVNGNIAIPWGSALRTTDTAHDGRTILQIGWSATPGDFVELYAPGVGLTNLVPQLMLTERNGVIVDPNGTNAGNLALDTLGLRFGFEGSGEGIGSKRTAGGNVNGLDFYTNFVSRLSITNTGLVDVMGAIRNAGTATDQTIVFHRTNETGVPNGDGFRMRYDNDFFGGTTDALVFEKTESAGGAPDGAIVFANTANDGIVDASLTIRGDGDVGIGTTAPVARLEVRASGARNAVAGYADTQNYSGVYGETSVAPSTGTEAVGVMGANTAGGVMGALGYGQNTFEFPSFYAVYGEGPSLFDGGVTIIGQLTIATPPSSASVPDLGRDAATGQLRIDTSSVRFKENIQPLVDDFEKVLELDPKSYTRPGNPDESEIGYIAEDVVEAGLCNLVFYDEEGLPLSVNYKKITLYLSEIARRQRDQIGDQRADIEELRADNESLRDRLAKLESLVSQLAKAN